MFAGGGSRYPAGGYVTPGAATASLTGYEPKNPSASKESGHVTSHVKIPDQMIKVLPEWSYSPASREHFLQMFARMLKSIGAVFLLHNKRVEVTPESSSEVGEILDKGQEFFSPSRDREQHTLKMQGDDFASREGVATCRAPTQKTPVFEGVTRL